MPSLKALKDLMPQRIEGMEYVCTLPRELGKVTKLEIKSGKLVCRTESGISMIVHKPR